MVNVPPAATAATVTLEISIANFIPLLKRFEAVAFDGSDVVERLYLFD